MKTLSIIIPTLNTKKEDWWTYIVDLFRKIVKSEHIILKYFKDYEIIIIKDKLVNEAWNEWVDKSKWEIIMILNDDIIIEDDVWFYMQQLQELQVYCPYYTRKEDYTKVYSSNWENIVWFCFAIHKKEWKDIPKELELRYWDNYIYEYMNHNILWGWNIHHFESKSLFSDEHKDRCSKIIEKDKLNWINIKQLICWSN